jgi:DegV family protein with EDD domain
MAIRYLDGGRLQRAFIAAANWVNARRDHLNSINVFPVPDGDTGTNMAATLAYAADGIAHLDSPNIADVKEALGRSVLVGARGNSGFILAQFTRGFLDGIGTETRRIHRSELAQAGQQAAQRAYDAIVDPVEGTILTVMREWSKAVGRLSEEMKDLSAIMDGALEEAHHALQQTQEQMALLKAHHVVDAGAQGFVHMLEGMSEFLRSGKVHPGRLESVAAPVEGAVDAAEAMGDLNYRFCSHALVENASIGTDEMKARLESLGDSLIVGGDRELMKVHVHTNDPDKLFAMLGETGTVLESRAEDMQAQTAALAAGRRYVRTGTEKQTVGIVLDSTCDLSLETAAEYGIGVVPCLVAFGDDVYRDKEELSLHRFYELLTTHPDHPLTSQPAPADFHQIYENALSTYERVLSVHVADTFSGTYQAARHAAREIAPDRITVLDSETLTAPLGAMGIQLARAARGGATVEDLTHRLTEMKSHSRLYCVLDSLDFLIRGGRISKLQGKVGQTLNLLPILTISGGKLEAVQKVRSPQKGMDAIFERLDVEIPEGAPVTGVAVHGMNDEAAREIAERFTGRYSPEEMMFMEIGPAVGSHAGPGAWGIFYLIGTTS